MNYDRESREIRMKSCRGGMSMAKIQGSSDVVPTDQRKTSLAASPSSGLPTSSLLQIYLHSSCSVLMVSTLAVLYLYLIAFLLF